MKIMAGVDSVEIDRIRRAMERSSFRRIFTDEELEYFSHKSRPAESAAGHFAAKEAFAKALGTGFRGFRPEHISICYTPLGAPEYRLLGPAAELLGSRSVSLSITHTREIATAFAVIYEEVTA